jgi:type IV pilus assembly protein PilM
MRAGIRSRPWAGVDVGTFSVKLVAAMPAVGGTRWWVAERPLPANGSAGERTADAVARAIGDCISSAGLSSRALRGVTLGVSGADVIVKQITLPLLTDDEVSSALRFEARKHLPFDPQSMVIDYQVMGRFLSEKKLEILIAAVSQERLARALAPLRLLDMDADIVDAAPLALSNAIAQGADLDRDVLMLLDIGHEASHLALHQRGQPYFSRRLEFGGQDLTRAIARGIAIPVEEAEEWKLAAGSDMPGFRVDWNGREMQAMLECLRHDLVDELMRSLAFYRTIGELPENPKLWVSGGSARLPGLTARLGELLGFPVELFNPFDAMHGPRAGEWPTVGPQFTQAFGLVQRTA